MERRQIINNKNEYKINFLKEEFFTKDIDRIKKQVCEWKKQWFFTAIVCLTGDLLHPAHIAYIKTIRKKIEKKFNLEDGKIKLIVWLEHESRTLIRKWKKTVLTSEERKYQWKHIKGVDDVYIRLTSIDLYPSDWMLYIHPDVWVSHQDYFDFNRYLRVSRKLRWICKALIINFDDPNKLLEEWNIREKFNISTTAIIERIIQQSKKKIWKILHLGKNNHRQNKTIINF